MNCQVSFKCFIRFVKFPKICLRCFECVFVDNINDLSGIGRSSSFVAGKKQRHLQSGRQCLYLEWMGPSSKRCKHTRCWGDACCAMASMMAIQNGEISNPFSLIVRFSRSRKMFSRGLYFSYSSSIQVLPIYAHGSLPLCRATRGS